MIFIGGTKYEDVRKYYIYDYDNEFGIAYVIALDTLERMDMKYSHLAKLHNESKILKFINLSVSGFTRIPYGFQLTPRIESGLDTDMYFECYTDNLYWKRFFFEDEEDDFMVGANKDIILFWRKNTVYKVAMGSSHFYNIYKEDGNLHLGLYNNLEYVLDDSGLYLFDDETEQECNILGKIEDVNRYRMRILCGYEGQ